MDNREYIEIIRAVVLGLGPLPPEPGWSTRKVCLSCGKKHRAESEICFTCTKKAQHEAAPPVVRPKRVPKAKQYVSAAKVRRANVSRMREQSANL